MSMKVDDQNNEIEEILQQDTPAFMESCSMAKVALHFTRKRMKYSKNKVAGHLSGSVG